MIKMISRTPRLCALLPTVLLLTGLSGRSSGALRPKVDLTALSAAAQLIAVGQVTDITAGTSLTVDTGAGPIPGKQRLATIQVTRVAKGMPATSLKISLFEPDDGSAPLPLTANQVAVFFLAPVVTDTWEPADVNYFAFPALTTPPAPSNSDPAIAEVVNVLASPVAPVSDRLQALLALSGVSGDAVVAALRTATMADDSGLHWNAMTGLLQRGDLSTLTSVQNTLMNPFADADSQYLPGLGAALEGFANKDDALPSIIQLFGSVNPEVRLGAASTVRSTGGMTAILSLPKLLSDDDQLVRYYAVIGLGEATDQPDWSPSLDEFRSNEQIYLSYWLDQSQQ